MTLCTLITQLIIILGFVIIKNSSIGIIKKNQNEIYIQRVFNKQTLSSVSNELIYHGGNLITKPKVYLVFWGSQWYVT